MATEVRTSSYPILGEAWPPHDTEESVLGTDLHQATIINLRWGINEVAHVNLLSGQLLPWQPQPNRASRLCPPRGFPLSHLP